MTVAAAAFVEAYVEVDGCRIRYLEGGPPSAPPLVWLHGSGGLHLSRAHELLAERYRVIAVETPGSGEPLSYPELAAMLASALGQLGLERFNLWGTSFGGMVSVWLAVGAPERIQALVLEAPAAIMPQDSVGPSRAETEAALATLDVPTLVVFGTRDGVVPPAMGRVYREKMPNCNYVLVYDAGHEVGAERPEAFVSLVSDFLERREAFIVNATSSLLNP